MRTLRWGRWLAIHPVEGASRRTNHGPPHLLPCHSADIHFPSDLFLPSCSVGVVRPCTRRWTVINMSVVFFPKYSFSLCFSCLAWTVGYAARHCPHHFQSYCYILSISVSFQETDRSTDEMNTEYRQNAPSVSVLNLEHKRAFSVYNNRRKLHVRKPLLFLCFIQQQQVW